MIDVNKVVDLVKLRFYQEWLYSNHLYDEGESKAHEMLTEQTIKTCIDPLNLKKDCKILDLGCGPGYFLDLMRSRGYTNMKGVTLSNSDVELCRSKGHDVDEYDISFLPAHKGYEDEGTEFVFLRHALEHSPYPIISLIEYNRILVQGGKIFIEVPAPDCERRHEYNLNHYSILGHTQWAALLNRTGFDIDYFNTLDYTLTIQDPEHPNDEKYYTKAQEKSYCILATKNRPLDVK
jgi:SAM-dependent methyltransferase